MHMHGQSALIVSLAHRVLAKFVMETVSFSHEEEVVIGSMFTSIDEISLLKVDENEVVQGCYEIRRSYKDTGTSWTNI
ncbi:hypothetical protein AVEN_28049-1 [Araneus ventricosus]|uniref:Uncharacterized protein n=1 Tax=Araneus ventricosus TaxID=182803 RepID=A0A4Y2BFC0_ARAVE|nr:hypothetical protein AVEN_28049-1 [Araneus ventricosus]